MADFLKATVGDDSFIRGAARLLWANTTIAFPTAIGDVINLTTGVGQYDAWDTATIKWNDLGATKTGIQISINNTEETFDVDQIIGDIDSRPVNWEVSVGTQLAEFTPERMQIAWEGGPVTVDTAPTPDEKVFTVGAPLSYTQRRLAVLFQRPSGKIRAYIFRKVQRMPAESNITHAKTGEQISIPVRFKCIADTSISDVYSRFFTVRDQL